MTARGHRNRHRGQDHRDQRREAKDSAGAVQRGADFRARVAGGFDAQPAQLAGLCALHETFHHRRWAGHHQPMTDAAAFLHQSGRRQVRQRHEHLGRHVEIIDPGVWFLQHQRHDPQARFAQHDVIANARAKAIRAGTA